MIQNKTVDITPTKITLPVIEMSQYDLGRQVIVHMKDGSDWFDLTGYTAKLQGTKPSGFGYTVDGVVDGHDITFASSYDMTSEAGFIPSEVRLTKDGVSLGSLNVILHVEKTPHDVTVTDGSPETIIPEMTELVERAEAAAEVLLDCSAIATTLPAGSNATASYDVDNGVFTFGIPRGNKGETGDTGATGNGIASITKTGTSGLVDTYTITFTNGTTTTFTVTNGQNGTGSVADVTQNGVSVLDGTTAKVTVPTYDAVTDNEPYLFRTSGGGIDIGNREVDTLVGGTVAWNQLVPTANKDFTSSVTDTSSYIQLYFRLNASPYTAFLAKTISTAGLYSYVVKATASGNAHIIHSGLQRNLTFVDNIPVTNGHAYFLSMNFIGVDLSTIGGVIVKNIQVFDLTQMFGSTIADYIYSLEQATAGAGVAWFKKLFPKPYYAYNAGELKSVSGLVSHDMTGFNAWDEETAYGYYNLSNGQSGSTATSQLKSANYTAVLPNTVYYYGRGSSGTTADILFYDADKNYISGVANKANKTFTTPDNCNYIRTNLGSDYGGTYNHDICINISSSRNGEYEPYVKHSYALDSTLTLRGIPKLSNGKLYYDGDTYASDGTVTRKYGIVTLDGSEPWVKSSSYNGNYYFVAGEKVRSDAYPKNGTLNIVTSNGLKPVDSVGALSNNDLCILVDGGYYPNINIKNTSKTTLEEFKAWLASNPITIVYELATPTTESADPYQNPQIVDDFGTEEYVSTSIVPVGHQTAYPDLFSGDYNDLVNKPTIPTATSDLTNDSNFVSDSDYVHTDNNYTSTEKSKLSGIEAGAEANVQADWNQTTTTADDYIKNKPTIPTVPTNVSAFTNDAGYITGYTETDPVFAASPAHGITSANISSWNGKASVSSITVSLVVANWSNNSQTVTATGVTASNNVIVSPAPASIDNYVAADIKCTAQASNSLTFTCTTTPSTAISVNVLVVS